MKKAAPSEAMKLHDDLSDLHDCDFDAGCYLYDAVALALDAARERGRREGLEKAVMVAADHCEETADRIRDLLSEARPELA